MLSYDEVTHHMIFIYPSVVYVHNRRQSIVSAALRFLYLLSIKFGRAFIIALGMMIKALDVES